MKYICEGVTIYQDDNYAERLFEECDTNDKDLICQEYCSYGWELIHKKDALVFKGDDNVILVIFNIREME